MILKSSVWSVYYDFERFRYSHFKFSKARYSWKVSFVIYLGFQLLANTIISSDRI